MKPNIFRPNNVIVQGITGKQGSFHAKSMLLAGTNIVAGTNPQKAGSYVDKIPVYAKVRDIQKDFEINASVIFVPASYARSAIFEAIDAKIPLIVCVTENIPLHDMLQIKQLLVNSSSIMIGPNCPGILVPGKNLLGIIPYSLSTPGDTAVVSRSGTLTYEAMDLLTKAEYGQKYIIGIGGDMIQGTGFTDCLEMFESDPEVKRIVMIGEIGGTEEIKAADYIEKHVTKPVYAYIAGHSAPAGVQMGHAGAILGTSRLETAGEKTRYLSSKGVITADSITDLISKIV